MASITEQVNRIIGRSIKFKNGKTIEETLMEAVDYLYICIQNEIDRMYATYKPIRYERRPYHEGLHSALHVEDFLDARIQNNRVEISLKFYKKNVWTLNFNRSHISNVAILMNSGWKWKSYDGDGEDDRFRKYGGYHFIENGIDNFNRTNKWGIYINKNDDRQVRIDESDWY